MVRNIEMFTKFGNAARDALNRKYAIGSLISILLLVCFPGAITGFVTNIILEPFQSSTGRALAHIGQEIRECFPPLANSDAAMEIIFTDRASLKLAPLKHGYPGAISRMERCPGRASVNGRTLNQPFSRKTTAGSSCAASQISVFDNSSVSAITQASARAVEFPIRSFVWFPNSFNNKSCKPCSWRDRFSFRHNIVPSIANVVLSALSATTGAHCEFCPVPSFVQA